MTEKTAQTYRVEICIAGEITRITEICRKYCFKTHLCVTVTPSEFVYTAGQEAGALIRLINYPKYPRSKDKLWKMAVKLAKILWAETYQETILVLADDKTMWFALQPKEQT